LAGDADFACNYIVSKRYRFLCALYWPSYLPPRVHSSGWAGWIRNTR
jgi:hypothetical protein